MLVRAQAQTSIQQHGTPSTQRYIWRGPLGLHKYSNHELFGWAEIDWRGRGIILWANGHARVRLCKHSKCCSLCPWEPDCLVQNRTGQSTSPQLQKLSMGNYLEKQICNHK